ncbi:MAG: DNA mismatch repair protein MutS [Candidatus Epulonipiscium fishelsonii]|nr:MAG: DNA mismatch repair protein MutS [Epulopiscium sp. AS2M-Bin002]
MMQQYFDIKEKHKDCIVLFRLGDFFEIFFDDAITASRELEIVLTGRECGMKEKAPMCGVPAHAVQNYISKLTEKGYKVAICDQIENASNAKGLVKRDIIRIITPGTVLEGNILQAEKNNYIASVVFCKNEYGVNFCDISTGTWQLTTFEKNATSKKVIDELAKFMPVECLISENLKESPIELFLKNSCNCLIDYIPQYILEPTYSQQILEVHFNILDLNGIGLTTNISILSAGALLNYLKETQKDNLVHLNRILLYNTEEYMLVDSDTRKNLEICETLRNQKTKGSLLWVLNNTHTAMGARYLRKCVEQPLINTNTINDRLNTTQELVENLFLHGDLIDYIKQVYDIERLISKIAFGTCNGKELLSLKNSIENLPQIQNLLKSANSTILSTMYNSWDNLEDIFNLIENSISEDCSISLTEGGLIKKGYNEEVDHYKSIKENGTSWLRDIENDEKEKTGIKNLKIKYNKIFGYFLEVTNSYSKLVPDYFIRKQTLSNCERFITPRLKEIEEEILSADEKLINLEYKLFIEIKDIIKSNLERISAISNNIAQLDMFCSFATIALKNNYVRPGINNSSVIEINNGRHPVVEKMMHFNNFIPNSTILDENQNQISLITGPNMAGKSTYMRQVALIVLMAQIGSFVPADSANIGVVDRIFTRIGASDDLSAGKSTFMVEMTEVANILNSATKNSLLILDEIGRGTSTIDGLSIATSIIEYIAATLGAKTLFATHYHELTSLEERYNNIQNYCVDVKEHGEDIIFLHKIKHGKVDHSYGIQVAKLAGVPIFVLKRAKQIMLDISTNSNEININNIATDTPSINVNEPVIEKLQEININKINPLEAMQLLDDLQKLII